MSDLVLWHGSPNTFDTFAHRRDEVRLGGYWTAADPVVAALYAGMGGVIYPVTAAPGVRVLDASGIDGVSPLHYLTPDELHLVTEAAERLGIRDKLSDPPGSGAEHFDHAEDRPCWEGLFQENVKQEDLGELIRACGYDAVLTHDSTEGIVGDMRATALRDLARRKPIPGLEDGATPETPSDFIRLNRCGVSLRTAERETPVLGFLTPESAEIHAALVITAASVLQAWETGGALPERPGLDALQTMASAPFALPMAGGMRR